VFSTNFASSRMRAGESDARLENSDATIPSVCEMSSVCVLFFFDN
jgi:hypothetical protein